MNIPTIANVESEKMVLGSILMNQTAFTQAAALIIPEDFSLDSHRKIFSAMSEMIDEGTKIDFSTLEFKLQSRHELKNVGGSGYITSLTDGLPRVKNITHYAEGVRERARQRMLVEICNVAADQAQQLEKPEEIIGRLEREVLEVLKKGRKFARRSMEQIARDTLSNILRLRDDQRTAIGLSTGLKALDRDTTGYREGEYYVIGARPGGGKSSLACQSIRVNCKAGKKCSFFSIEMTEEQVMHRLVAMESGVDVFDLRDPRMLNDMEVDRVAQALQFISSWPLTIDDSSRITAAELTARARLFISQGAEAVYVDYLQRVAGEKGQSPFDRVTDTSEALCELAKSTGVPVIALSQLRRPESGSNSAPSLDDLRQSGQIEQDVHAAFLLWRPRDQEGFTGMDEIIVGKQRSGPAGHHIKVSFNGPKAMFEERA